MSPVTEPAARVMTPAAARTAWDDLPELVRLAVKERVGSIHHVHPVTNGLNAAFTARLHTDSGLIFAKGVRSDRATAQRREADINPHVLPIAPRLLWHIDAAGWHLLGFEHLDGRSANLGPKSIDLPAVALVLGKLTELELPSAVCKRIEDRWADAAQQAEADVDLLAGNHLLHTDLNPHNIIITDAGPRIVDWSWPTLGAAWIDTACAALWLIAEGHAPVDAEVWSSQVPVWASVSPYALNAFATINAALWEQIAASDPRPWKQRLHHAARAWVDHRRTLVVDHDSARHP